MFTRDKQHKQPGKFEGNSSELTARILYDCVLNEWCDQEVGEACGFGWYGLIVGKRYGFIVKEDSQGFFTYWCGPKEKAKAKWSRIEHAYEVWSS